MEENVQQDNHIDVDDRQDRAAQRDHIRNLQAEADERLRAHKDLLNQNNILQQALVAHTIRTIHNLPRPKLSRENGRKIFAYG